MGAEDREDLENVLDEQTIDRAIVQGRAYCLPARGVHYTTAFDAALGGTTGGDSFTSCTVHLTDNRMVVDQLAEVRPKFNPNEVIDQFVAQLVQPYGVTVVHSDRFAKDFLTDRLRQHGIRHETTDFDRSAAYLAALPWFTTGRIEFLDPKFSTEAQRCVAQLVQLQRRTGNSGKDAIDHVRGSHDDLANVLALAIAQAGKPRRQHGGYGTVVGF